MDEYDVDATTIAKRDAARKTKPTTKDTSTGDDGFQFDYIPAYDPSSSSSSARRNNTQSGTGSGAGTSGNGSGGGGGRNKKDKDAFDLGLDEEIEIKPRATRTPLAKLDDDRMTDAKVGLPRFSAHYAPRIASHCRRLRSRPVPKTSSASRRGGVAEEYSDFVRILEEYQMWMHQLWPKAKFVDCVKLVRRAGKTARVRAHRRGMIDALIRPADVDGEQGVGSVPPSARGERPAVAAPQQTVEQDVPEEFDDFPEDFEMAAPAAPPGDDDDDDLDALEAMGWA